MVSPCPGWEPHGTQAESRQRWEGNPSLSKAEHTNAASALRDTPLEHSRSDTDELGLQIRSSTCRGVSSLVKSHQRGNLALLPLQSTDLQAEPTLPAPAQPSLPAPHGDPTASPLWICPPGTGTGSWLVTALPPVLSLEPPHNT